MMLNEFKKVASIEVWRDGSFSTLGFLSDPQPDMLVFIEDKKYTEILDRTPKVSCVITTDELGKRLEHIPGLAVSSNPRLAFFILHNYLVRHTDFYWTDFPTKIDKTAQIHPHAYIAEKNVQIGPDTIIGPNVTISERCLIGSEVVIRPGVVLGSAGFQTTQFREGIIDMIHAGGIQINDKVDILSNAVISHAVFRQFTTIGHETRIGNLAFLSHNVQIGPRCFIGHGGIINGNVKIGADVWIGPGATIVNNIEIGDRAIVSLGSTVIENVSPGQRVTSNIAIDHKKYLRHIASIKRGK
jgi:UDP-3-O-[3-hydroxymyristoyl] glucosamine N-acyltransferase